MPKCYVVKIYYFLTFGCKKYVSQYAELNLRYNMARILGEDKRKTVISKFISFSVPVSKVRSVKLKKVQFKFDRYERKLKLLL